MHTVCLCVLSVCVWIILRQSTSSLQRHWGKMDSLASFDDGDAGREQVYTLSCISWWSEFQGKWGHSKSEGEKEKARSRERERERERERIGMKEKKRKMKKMSKDAQWNGGKERKITPRFTWWLAYTGIRHPSYFGSLSLFFFFFSLSLSHLHS